MWALAACSILGIVQEAAVGWSTVISYDLVPSAASGPADHLQAGGKATLASFSRGLLGCTQPATGNHERLPRGTKGDLSQINQPTPKPQQRFSLQRAG